MKKYIFKLSIIYIKIIKLIMNSKIGHILDVDGHDDITEIEFKDL